MAASAKNRQYPTAYKLKTIKRVEQGEAVLPVARELGISRKLLHDWIKAWKAHGPEGLNRKPGPKPGPRKLKPLQPEANKRSALARANARIAELERLVGRQQMDIDFFRKALRAMERPATQGKPASASSKSSKP
ncbi:transposase [Bradyrhizobium sp. RDI18]|uniref:transposase n=1 Tax=Bradyrhizobium sp. RDI18 TaxID=3367400 RepID=UPI0037199726